MRKRIVPLLAFCLIACARAPMTTPLQSIATMSTPAADDSGEPNLNLGPDGRVYLTWIEPAGGETQALRIASTHGEQWSDAATIASGDNWFVNWADFPTLVATADGTLYTHWLAKTGSDTYAYGVNIAVSADDGKTWSKSVMPHRDGTETEHGFVSMVPWDASSALAIWLDGRNYAGESATNEMTLRAATISPEGGIGNEALLDERTCDCCQTALARTANGAIAAYRDRSEGEIRDISFVRLVDGRWTRPATIADGWKIDGCPVNGPAIDTDGTRVAVAWFTAAAGVSKVQIALSDDEGATFGPPIRIDDGDPMGRADIALLPNGGVFVIWLESIGDEAEVLLRYIPPTGEPGATVPVVPSDKGRGSGFPHIARSGDRVYFAWTETGDISHVRTAVVSLAGSGLMTE